MHLKADLEFLSLFGVVRGADTFFSCLHRNCPWGLTVCGPLSPDPRLSSGMNRERFFLFRASFGACVLPPRPTSSFGTLREAENVH